MHGMELLHRLALQWCPDMHSYRRAGVLASVEAVVRGERLTLTGVGRELSGQASEKHKVKRIDRLLGNRHLHAEREALYAGMAAGIAGRGGGYLPVVVDWTPGPAERFQMLEAAVPMGGRALLVYQRTYAPSAYKNPRVQQQFVHGLARVLPEGVAVVVVADAGFQRSFFAAVEAQGWHWVRRLGEPLSVRGKGQADWQRLRALEALARGPARDLGEYEVGKTAARHVARLCVARPARRFRRDRPNDREHGHGTMAKRYRQLYQSPWVLATNLPAPGFTAADIVQLYARRMSIEETFRDLKSHRYGYAMDYTGTRDVRRLEVLRLLGALAMYVQYLAGLVARCQGLSRHFQVNTERRRAVLSIFTLGRRLLRSERFGVALSTLYEALNALPAMTLWTARPE